jgi:putative transposase
MARLARKTLGPAYFHVFNRSHERAPIFARPTDYQAFLGVLAEGLDKYPMRLISYCVLSNHWHLVVGPSGIPVLSRFVRWVAATHSIRLHRVRNAPSRRPLYQGRFRSVSLYRASDLLQACRYVERNALAAGLVKRAEDWPWGSLADRLSDQRRVPVVSTSFLTSQAWIDYVNEPKGTEVAEQFISLANRQPPSP